MQKILGRQSITGALEPPPGVQPNFTNPPSIAKYNILCQAVCLPIITLFVALRLHTRFFIHREKAADDYACLVAWFGSFIYSGMALSLNGFGAGIHQWDVPLTKIFMFGKLVYVTQMFYGPQVFVTKLAILLLLSRLFGRDKRVLWTIRILIGLMAAYYIPATAAKIFICWPVAHFWNPGVQGTCLNENSIFLADCAMSIISDFTILILPMPLIWNLKMHRIKKIGITAAFGAGALACTASLLRLYETLHLNGTPDKTYGLIPILLWSIAEVNIGIICACLPILPSLFKRIFPQAPKTGSSRSTNENNRYYRLERLSKPLKKMDDSILQETVVDPVDGISPALPGPSWIVEATSGSETNRKTWSGDGIMKTKTYEVSQAKL